MAYEAKDGKKYTNRPPMMQHNRSLERAQSGEAATEHSDPLQQPGQEGEMDGHAMAREHGPAVEVNVMHDHEGRMHKVHAKHPDGHEHESDHPSAEAAHDHAKACAGCGMQDGSQMEEPEFE